MNKIYNSKSEEDTKNIAFDFAKHVKNGDNILLYGDLGYGKTTFVKHVLSSMGVKDRVASPTFTIIKEYKLEDKNIYHIDLYRLENSSELKALGMDDMLKSPSVVFIEWPEKLQKDMLKRRIDVKFLLNNDNTRVINITKYE